MERTNHDLLVLEAMAAAALPAGAISLAEQLGIPSANIGRTLNRLEKKGYVQKVDNKGRVITAAGRAHLEECHQLNQKIDIAHEIIDTAQSGTHSQLSEILTVRRLLEGYAAQECAAHASPDQIRQLEDLQLDYTYELRHGRSGSEQDLALHLAIAEGSGNAMIVRILKLLLTESGSYNAFTNAAVKVHELSVEEHQGIVDAIRARDGELARSEMEGHLTRVKRNLDEAAR